jgi:hypothetical protein
VPRPLRIEEICLIAVRNDKYALHYVPGKLRSKIRGALGMS